MVAARPARWRRESLLRRALSARAPPSPPFVSRRSCTSNNNWQGRCSATPHGVEPSLTSAEPGLSGERSRLPRPSATAVCDSLDTRH